jgi:hypothetical protein
MMMMRLWNVALTGQWFFFLSLRFPSAFFFSSALLFLLFPVLFFLSLSGPLKRSLFYSFFLSATVFIPALFFFFVSGFLK